MNPYNLICTFSYNLLTSQWYGLSLRVDLHAYFFLIIICFRMIHIMHIQMKSPPCNIATFVLEIRLEWQSKVGVDLKHCRKIDIEISEQKSSLMWIIMNDFKSYFNCTCCISIILKVRCTELIQVHLTRFSWFALCKTYNGLIA